ncbi:MAG: hypothetical protein R3A52_22045 [Polyangiales bacterium]
MLSLRLRRALGLSAAALGFVAGCGDDARPSNDDHDSGTYADAGATDGASSGYADVAAPPCGRGSGRLRVAIALDPALERRSPDVWLAVRCGASETPARVVRWDRSTSQVIDGLGPGDYRVFGSSFVAPGAWSAPVALRDLATAAVPMTLPSEGTSLGAVNSPDLRPAEGGAWMGRRTLMPAGVTTAVGVLEVTVVPSPATSTVSVQAVVRNNCTASCPTVVLHSVEVRTLDQGEPVGLAVGRFAGTDPLAPGESATLPQALTLAGRVPDGRYGVEVSLLGQVSTTASNARP